MPVILLPRSLNASNLFLLVVGSVKASKRPFLSFDEGGGFVRVFPNEKASKFVFTFEGVP